MGRGVITLGVIIQGVITLDRKVLYTLGPGTLCITESVGRSSFDFPSLLVRSGTDRRDLGRGVIILDLKVL